MSLASPPRTLPYGRQCIDDSDVAAVTDVLRSDWLTQGPEVARFERALADYCGARHAVAVSSGTAALHLATLAAGVRWGDRVIVPTNTFVATANAVRFAGGEPLFADIEAETRNIDPDSVARIPEQARGVIAVHFAGCPADMNRLSKMTQRRGWFLIEDASHALGASWLDDAGNWRRVGACSHSDMATFSFHPVKHMTTGEGGAILTNRDDLADRLRSLRSHGIVRDPERIGQDEGPWYYEMQELGFNYRITDIQCSLGLSQIQRLNDWIERRGRLVERYRAALRSDSRVGMAEAPEWAHPAWHLFAVEVPRRREVFERLRERGLGVQVHYIPVHLQPYYRERLGTVPGDCPVAENYYAHALSLPLFPAMDDDDVDHVVMELKDALDAVAS